MDVDDPPLDEDSSFLVRRHRYRCPGRTGQAAKRNKVAVLLRFANPKYTAVTT
jgi:hypothetical protein